MAEKKLFIEQHEKDWVSSKTGEPLHRVDYLYPYWAKKPKRTSLPGVTMIEVEPPPNEYFDPAVDENENFIWKYNNERFLNERIRPLRDNALQKPLALIDQYRNETDMLKEGIITKRKITDAQYKDAQQYLQALKDWPDNADIEVDGYNEPKIPDSLKELIKG